MIAKFKGRVIIAVATLAVALLLAGFTPILLDLRKIQTVRDQYYLDAAIDNEFVNTGRYKPQNEKPTAEQFLNPSYLTKYNLSMNDYIDANGYFAPNGNHWTTWSQKTKIAAILMFADGRKLTVLEIWHTSKKVDEYYAANAKFVPVVQVVRGILKVSAAPPLSGKAAGAG
jgi:hypothetical protein